jgi:hypothetical protein
MSEHDDDYMETVYSGSQSAENNPDLRTILEKLDRIEARLTAIELGLRSPK